MHLGSVQADVAQFENSYFLCQQKHLDEEILEVAQERVPKGGQGIMSGTPTPAKKS